MEAATKADINAVLGAIAKVQGDVGAIHEHLKAIEEHLKMDEYMEGHQAINDPANPGKVLVPKLRLEWDERKAACLGAGTQGRVYAGRVNAGKRAGGTLVAVKVFNGQKGSSAGRREADFIDQTAHWPAPLPAWLPQHLSAHKVSYKGQSFRIVVMERLAPPGIHAKNPNFISLLAKALRELHAMGFVHNDFSTNNFLTRQPAPGAQQTPVLIDFGGCLPLHYKSPFPVTTSEFSHLVWAKGEKRSTREKKGQAGTDIWAWALAALGLRIGGWLVSKELMCQAYWAVIKGKLTAVPLRQKVGAVYGAVNKANYPPARPDQAAITDMALNLQAHSTANTIPRLKSPKKAGYNEVAAHFIGPLALSLMEDPVVDAAAQVLMTDSKVSTEFTQL